jgi:formylmethanofuran dehydrogenase subunit C
VEMRRGVAFVKGSVKGYVGARMTGGRIICRKTKPIPPATERKLEKMDLGLLARYGVAGMFALSYGRYEV